MMSKQFLVIIKLGYFADISWFCCWLNFYWNWYCSWSNFYFFMFFNIFWSFYELLVDHFDLWNRILVKHFFWQTLKFGQGKKCWQAFGGQSDIIPNSDLDDLSDIIPNSDLGGLREIIPKYYKVDHLHVWSDFLDLQEMWILNPFGEKNQ